MADSMRCTCVRIWPRIDAVSRLSSSRFAKRSTPLATPTSGFLISCAIPEASSPTEASCAARRISCSWSSWISWTDARSSRDILLKVRPRSPSSSARSTSTSTPSSPLRMRSAATTSPRKGNTIERATVQTMATSSKANTLSSVAASSARKRSWPKALATETSEIKSHGRPGTATEVPSTSTPS